MKSYLNILTSEGKNLEADEVSDIIVNYLACQSSTSSKSTEEVKKVMAQFSGFDQTYEYFFNLSQVYLKDDMVDESLKCLRSAYDKAVKDDSFKDDQVRFKVQEMHFLNELQYQYSNVEYSTVSN